jgi:hypothetical protein
MYAKKKGKRTLLYSRTSLDMDGTLHLINKYLYMAGGSRGSQGKPGDPIVHVGRI